MSLPETELYERDAIIIEVSVDPNYDTNATETLYGQIYSDTTNTSATYDFFLVVTDTSNTILDDVEITATNYAELPHAQAPTTSSITVSSGLLSTLQNAGYTLTASTKLWQVPILEAADFSNSGRWIYITISGTDYYYPEPSSSNYNTKVTLSRL